jgi:hypothetical protein
VGIQEFKKTAIRAVLGCLILVFLASAPYMAAQAGHDCTHDKHCPGCVQLQCVLDLLRHLNTAVLRTGLWAGIFGFAAAPGRFPILRAVPASSVALKVRMNA